MGAFNRPVGLYNVDYIEEIVKKKKIALKRQLIVRDNKQH